MEEIAMFRRIVDFEEAWTRETDATRKVLGACTDASLDRMVAPGGRSLGRLAWHLVLTLPEMMGQAGLEVSGPAEDASVPPLAVIADTYATCADAVREAVARRWTDALLEERIPMYGEAWRRGDVLVALILHQAHHRGQMTVLMRQAGLRVPGVYGPAAEEWTAMGLNAPV
jgi:uncharacterized damage-inducible protein DinB